MNWFEVLLSISTRAATTWVAGWTASTCARARTQATATLNLRTSTAAVALCSACAAVAAGATAARPGSSAARGTTAEKTCAERRSAPTARGTGTVVGPRTYCFTRQSQRVVNLRSFPHHPTRCELSLASYDAASMCGRPYTAVASLR